MASARVIEASDECIVNVRAFSNDPEENDEVVIEIDEFVPSEKSFLKEGSVIAALNHKNCDMEEGELSGEEVQIENRRRVLQDDGTSHMVNQRQPIQITIQNKDAAKLPVCSFFQFQTISLLRWI